MVDKYPFHNKEMVHKELVSLSIRLLSSVKTSYHNIKYNKHNQSFHPDGPLLPDNLLFEN